MSLDTIGQKLKSAREAQGLSLRQIYERTKIPINHLQAIDNGAPDDLPEVVYVAGFIKRYAECIGLDGQVLADEYRRQENGAASGNGNGKSKLASQPVYVTPDYIKHTRIDNSAPTYKLLPFYGLIIVVVIGAISWYTTQNANNNQPDPNVLSLKESVNQLQQNAPIGATGTVPATGATPALADKVVLTGNQHVWLEVKRQSSGEALFTGYLEQGDRREFQDSQGLRIRAGNGGNVSVEFKGKIEPFGQLGKVSERTFNTVSAVASTDPAQTDKPATGSGDSSTVAATAPVKPKKVRRTAEATSTRRFRPVDDSGTRSIPSESGGDGMRSIDVPYRYSEGRLDSN